MASRQLYRLQKKKWLVRLERGKYMIIPLEAGVDRQWAGDPYLVATSLVKPAAIAYSTAIRHWGWTEGEERPVCIQTTTRKNVTGRTVGAVRYEFITLRQTKFFGHITEVHQGTSVLVTDREKTLIDAADDVERAGGVHAVVAAVRGAAGEILWPKLEDYGLRFPNRSALKRLGFIVESEMRDIPAEGRRMLERWRTHLSAGVVLLQPGEERKGRISTRWRVHVNVSG
ncbi:MAG TPA: hypothetical protein VMM80_00575 [Bacteroidota bacterium]|nr:hypothetical protein [Bacteroidota bacterium]